MVRDCFASRVASAPGAAHPKLIGVGIDRWMAAAEGQGGNGLAAEAKALLADERARALVAAVFGNSPYLTGLAERDPDAALRVFRDGPDSVLDAIQSSLDDVAASAAQGQSPAAALRGAKRRLAFAVAVADIANAWSVERITAALSEFAERALGIGVRYVLADAARLGKLHLDADDPDGRSGLIVLGLGKLGGRELNYSSDIDLIVFYDPERMNVADHDTLQRDVNRMTRSLVRVMADRTGEGYVFRTDLRLRPDPASTPPAISVLAAETYYETMGQNWERAAMIKARPVAGDGQAADAFLRYLIPFIWRRNLDFAAIQDIHSIKRQINAHRGSDRIALAGHNVKLGRGGIREIEFFAQTQQLIWGGRLPEVRVIATIDALHALAKAGKIGADVADELTRCYRFLRRVEHRLQMINDEQTHTLPDDPEKLAAFAVFLGYADAGGFSDDLLATLRRVESRYVELFEGAPALSLEGFNGGNLVFTGSESDPDTIATLRRLGFTTPNTVDQAVRGWHHGRYPAMRSGRARELLTELMPLILKALSDTPDPDAAFLAFDRFLRALPAGVQLFSLLYAHPDLLDMLADILGVAPRLGDQLARKPSLFDAVLSEDFFDPLPSLNDLQAELEQDLSGAADAEDLLDRSRRWANDRRFQVGVQSLRNILDVAATGPALSDIAEATLRALKPRIEDEFARQHGRIAGAGLAIIAMGKLGSREMTATSDLDLIFVYTAPELATPSDGRRPLPASQYFARLSQRLISAITSPTTEGALYEVDMRLRPSGKAGPIAVGLDGFCRYQREEAWTWERMALTRARVIAGPKDLRDAIERAIHDVLTLERDPQALVKDVAEMRARMAGEFPAEMDWEIKHRRGGLIDIEFIAQYLQLRHAHAHPPILARKTRDALDKALALGALAPDDARTLVDALDLWQRVHARLRLRISGQSAGKPGAGTLGVDDDAFLRRALDGTADLDFDRLKDVMNLAAARVRGVFQRLIDEPAAASDAGGGT
jgi:[glutamine synthetase] adenylyltransferase / [glutamine synthetase]-adenylyl-L-tyrosine phosphorylase